MDEELSRQLAQARRLLRSLRWPLAAAPLVGAALGLFASGLVTPRYVSSTTVSLKDQDVFNNLLKDLVAPVNSKTSTASAKALVETAPVLDRVALRAGLVDSGASSARREAVRSGLAGRIRIQQTGSESGLFTITATAPEAGQARDLATAFGREFLVETANLRMRTAHLALDYLRQQMEQTQAQLEAKRAEAASYRARNVFSLPEFALDGTINLLQIRKEQLETKARLAEVRKRIELIREFYRHSDPRLAALRAELQEVLSQRERLRGDYTERHPVMRELLFRERQVRRLIAGHVPDTGAVLPRDRITVQIASDGKPGFSAAPGDAFLLGRQFQEQDLQLEEELLRVRLGQMDSLLGGLKIDLERIPELQRVLAGQQDEIERLQKSYDEIRSRWTDARNSIEVGRLDLEAAFSVASPASLPESPVYPVPLAFALVGALLLVFLVAGAGAGIAWWQGTVRDEKDVEQDLGVACLGTIPDLRPRKGGRT